MFQSPFVKNLHQIVSNSGGLYYHLRYLLRRGSGWEIYKKKLEQWLATIPTDCDLLILLGPSGGYTLPESFLAKFTRIVSIDLDPLSPLILKKRFPKIQFDFETQNFFVNTKGKIEFDHLSFNQKFPKGLLLFANLLGQLSLEGDFDFENLRGSIANRSWISLHDRWIFQNWYPSSYPEFKNSTEEEVLRCLRETPAFPQNRFRSILNLGPRVQCSEFPTQKLNALHQRLPQAKSSQVFLWQIQSYRSLLIEGVYYLGQNEDTKKLRPLAKESVI